MSLGLTPQEIVERDAGRTLPLHPHWPRIELGDVAVVQNGYAFPSTSFNSAAGVPLIRIRDVKRGTTGTFFEGNFPPEYIVPSGSVLIGMDGDFNCAIWPGPPALLNQRVCRIIPKDGHVSEKFLAFVLPAYLKVINEHTSSITVKHLSSRTVQKIPIPLPPLDEQKQIVAEIETQFARLDDAVAALERARARLKRYRASVLKAACEGRLVPTEAELARQEGRDYEPASVLLERIRAEREANPGKKRGSVKKAPAMDTTELADLPEGWEWTTVGDAASEVRYGTSAKTHENSDGIPVLRMGNIVDGKLDFRSLKFLDRDHPEFPELLLKYNDILFNRTNSAELVGKSAVYRGNVPECSYASYLIRVRLIKEYFPDLLVYYINSVHGRAWVRSVVNQQVGQANVNGTKLKALTIPVPPTAEQERIVAEVERRMSVIDQLEATVDTNLKRAESLRQSILRQAFGGRPSKHRSTP